MLNDAKWLLMLATLTPCAGALSAPAVVADDFENFDFDVTRAGGLDTYQPTSWHHTLRYEHGWAEAGGSVVQRLVWRAQWDGLISDELFFSFDARFRLLGGKDRLTPDDRNYDSDARVRSLFVQTSSARWALLGGYQVVNLGFMDIISITDVLAPWDYAEPAYTAPEDARLGQPMLSVSRFTAAGGLHLYINLHADTTRYPADGLNAQLASQFGPTGFDLQNDEPEPLDRGEVVLRYQHSAGDNEHEFILASVVQNDPAVDIVALLPRPQLRAVYPRYGLAGYAWSHTSGNTLWKIEAAFKNKLRPVDLNGLEVDSLELGLGMEYSPGGEWTLAAEAAQFFRDLPAGSTGLEDDPWQIAVRWSDDYYNETLNVVAFAAWAEPGPVVTSSLSFQYEVRDELIVELIATHIDVRGASPFADLLEAASSTVLRTSYHW